MNTEQISNILQSFKKKHKSITFGVYAADTLPHSFKKTAAFIANTDTRSKPGTHWVAFIIPKRGKPIYFDSYGLPPYIDQHLTFLKSVSNKHRFNNKSLQSITSKLCGHYCIYFIHEYLKNNSLKLFQDKFTFNVKENDNIVKKAFKCLKIKKKAPLQVFGKRNQLCCSRCF